MRRFFLFPTQMNRFFLKGVHWRGNLFDLTVEPFENRDIAKFGVNIGDDLNGEITFTIKNLEPNASYLQLINNNEQSFNASEKGEYELIVDQPDQIKILRKL